LAERISHNRRSSTVSPIPDAICADTSILRNEPTFARDNMTNETAFAADVGLESPTYMKATEQNARSKPTFARENMSNEPAATIDYRNLVSEVPPELAATVESGGKQESLASENVESRPTENGAPATVAEGDPQDTFLKTIATRNLEH
jgi:hypothetical protein